MGAFTMERIDFSLRRNSRVLRQLPMTWAVCRMPTAKATSTAPTAMEKMTSVTGLSSNLMEGLVWTATVPGFNSRA